MEIYQIVLILQNNISKIHMLKLLKCQKILKNQKIHYLEIIETKKKCIYNYTIEKYKKKISYHKKNKKNQWL